MLKIFIIFQGILVKSKNTRRKEGYLNLLNIMKEFNKPEYKGT